MGNQDASLDKENDAMMSLTAVALLHVTLIAGAKHDYATAHRLHAETGRPLVILLGTDWCPGCRVMKQSSIPKVERRGGLSKVAFAIVNTDRERSLANTLMKGGSIPQLVMYKRTPKGWRLFRLIGAQSPEQIESFIGKGLESTETATKVTPVDGEGKR